MEQKKSAFISAFTLIFFCISFSVNAASLKFDVYAKANSTSGLGYGLNTGINYSVGDMVSGFVAADDFWNAGALPRWSNADGLYRDIYSSGTDDSGELAGVRIGRQFGLWNQHGLSLPYGSLVGEINNIFFLLGSDFDVTATESGVLSLYYWDSNSADNSEFITVSINDDMSAVPVPAAVWLFGSGLLGMLGLRMKT